MAKLTLADVTNILGNPTSAANTINANNALIEAALENTLSRDGTAPNQMSSDLDLNGNDLLNSGGFVVPTATSDPSFPSDGQIYYNTTSDKLRLRANGVWVDLN